MCISIQVLDTGHRKDGEDYTKCSWGKCVVAPWLLKGVVVTKGYEKLDKGKYY